MTDRVIQVTVAAQVSAYLTNMKRATDATNKAAEATEAATAKFERQNAAMSEIGRGLATFGGVAMAASAIAVKAAVNWESAWAGVTKTVDGTPEQMDRLEESLRGLTSILPATHEEIAGVAEAAGQLGVQRENVAAFTRTMIDLSETTNLTADEAATSIAQLMNVMQTAPDDVDNLGAALVALGNDGASTERDIVQMAQRIAGAGRIVGLTESEVLGFANALASVGIEAEAGGSAISRIMTDIAMSVSAGGDKLELFAEVAGMSAEQFSASFKGAPADAMATFIEGLARVNAEGGDVFATLDALGQSDIRVSQALLGMANSGDLLRESLQLGTEAWGENVALVEEAEKRYATTEAKLQIAGNAVRDAAIDYGTVFLPALSAVAEAVTAVAAGFSALPQPVQNAIVGFSTLAGVAALAGGAFLIAVPKVAEFSAALAVLRTSGIPAVAKAADLTSGAATRMGRAFSATASFLTGPYGLALAAAAVGTEVLKQALDAVQASSEQMQNSLKTAGDAADVLSTASKGKEFAFFRDVGADLEDLDGVLEKSIAQWENVASRIFDSSNFGAERALEDIGVELASLAESDLPAAQSAFQMLADETDGSHRHLWALLSLTKDYRDELIEQATAQGINVGALEDAETQQVLLNLAMEQASPPAETAAEAYKAAAEEAQFFTDEIMSLIDAVNQANGVGQDAVSSNARWQSALAGISEEVQRQKDAYEEANGSLDGFAATLNETTAAGAENSAMLAETAAAAQDAAQAQYEHDLATMGAKDATDRYIATLAAQRQAFIDSATEAGFNADEVQALADKVFALPDEKTIQTMVEAAESLTLLDRVRAAVDAIDPSKTITIGVAVGGAIGAGLAVGEGIPGRAGGGILPGAPSSVDNMLIKAATGEYVVNAAQTAIPENRQALEYINSGGVIRGFARGGEVQPTYVAPWQRPSSSPAGRSGGNSRSFSPTIVAQNVNERELVRLMASEDNWEMGSE